MKGVYSVTLTVEHVFGLTAAKVITALGPLLGEDLIFFIIMFQSIAGM